MEQTWLVLAWLLPMVAFLYASVGHGGASSYLMLLTLFDWAPEQIRPTALLLNMAVSLLAFLSYRRACVFPRSLFLSLIVFSVPAALYGGTLTVDASLYRQILGVLLLFPILRFLNVFPVATSMVVTPRWWIAALLGLAIGFVSGLIGIGGGIILSPMVLMLGWASMKETAALSTLFIFCNSLAGLLGAGILSIHIAPELWALLPLALLGGGMGAYFGAHRFNVKLMKQLLAVVLLVASSKLILS